MTLAKLDDLLDSNSGNRITQMYSEAATEPTMQDETYESSNQSRNVADHAAFYAAHLGALLDSSSAWLRRRVANYTILDADTIQLSMSVDFDLTECPEGLRYLSDMQAERRRYSKEHRHEGLRHLKMLHDPLPFLLPIGLYSHPYVGFDLRDYGDSRVSLITKDERDEILKYMQFNSRINERLHKLLDSGELAIAELPSTYDSGRGVLHYTHLLRWRADRQAFPFLPPSADEDRNTRRPIWFTRAWWRRIRVLLGWHPLRVVIPLLNVYLCASYHIELHTPEGIRIHRTSIVTEDGAGRQEPVSEKTTEIPPSHAYALTHYNKIRNLNGDPLIFRAWLSLDRRGFTAVVMFLALLNLVVSAGAALAVIFRTTSPDISTFVPVLTLAAAAAFAYLYVPGEHGLSRGLYSYVRRVLVATASLTLVIAADLSILNGFLKDEPGTLGPLGQIEWAFQHLGILGYIALCLALAIVFMMALDALVLIVGWWNARDKRVAQWVDKQLNSGSYAQFGWHTVEPLHRPRPVGKLDYITLIKMLACARHVNVIKMLVHIVHAG